LLFKSLFSKTKFLEKEQTLVAFQQNYAMIRASASSPCAAPSKRRRRMRASTSEVFFVIRLTQSLPDTRSTLAQSAIKPPYIFL
jgi:hypothetical protein